MSTQSRAVILLYISKHFISLFASLLRRVAHLTRPLKEIKNDSQHSMI